MFWMYAGFIALVLVLLALDLGVFHRKAHVVSVREALGWSAFWITLGLLFSGFIYAGYENHWMGLGLTPDQMTIEPVELAGVGTVYNDGADALVKYITGYLVEKSLAVDNIFVIAMLFGFFAVPQIYQHRVLFWGILGALLMRGVMIALGAQLLQRFTWIIYVFGGFLILTGIKMLLLKSDETDPNRNIVVRLVRKIWPVTEKYHGEHFFVRAGSDASHEAATPGAALETDRVVDAARPGTLLATPLLLALIMVEVTDLIFAVDSIPAIFAITTDPFLVFTSNVFAMLGLRSLYFALAGMIDEFRYLKVALAVVLMVVGVKMMTHSWLKTILGQHFNLYLLGVVLAILFAGVAASILHKRLERQRA
ncbi:MAG TPA: TerC/Alx family metal homeostasis membrane protein [Vicinamibacteria bacterium]|nr:TerC/Alx family metal homeostasis membrane protein [Vicinamibacteria bacterium]HRB12948.1 TerC/Alx family metal homeostasis membrane protein [Vicinamibacteria bacterium]